MRPVEAFECIYRYLNGEIVNQRLVRNNLLYLIAYHKANPDDEEWKNFYEQLDWHIHYLLGYIVNVVKTFSYDDVYYDYFGKLSSSENEEIKYLYRYLNMPYKDMFNARIDFLIFKYFIGHDHLFKNPQESYADLFSFLSEYVTIYDYVEHEIDILDDSNDGYIMQMSDDLECAKSAAFDFVYQKFRSIDAFYNTSEIKSIQKYGTNEQIKENFLDFYNHKDEYLSDPQKSNQAYGIIGHYGELLFEKYLIDKYGDENVFWISRDIGDGFGYDFIVSQGDSCIAYEVKTTIAYKNLGAFKLSANEYRKFEEENAFAEKIVRPDNYFYLTTNMSELRVANILVNPEKIIRMDIYGVDKDSFNGDHYLEYKYNEQEQKKEYYDRLILTKKKDK